MTGLSQPVSREFLKGLLVQTHKDLWTPSGLKRIAQWSWDACGRPGGGLKDKIKNWWRNPLRLPRLDPVPLAKRAPLREPDPVRLPWPEFDFDFRLPELSPEAVRDAATAAAAAIVIGGMILLIPIGI